MFLQIDELKTHLYQENINLISRDDETILAAAIDGAMQEAKGYLGNYDKNVIFSAKKEERHTLLLIFIKDIAVWHFINLCNGGTDLELREKRYSRAIDWLKAVQKGTVTPDLPALREDDGDKATDGIRYGSNPKRNQHF